VRAVVRVSVWVSGAFLLVGGTLSASSVGPPLPRQLRLQRGALQSAGARVFQLARGADGRLGLGIRARVGSVASGASARHPAPETGAFQVWPVAGSGRGDFHLKGRLYAESADGLIGLAVVTPKGEWYIAGTVPGRTGPVVDLSRSSEGWKTVSRAKSAFSPAPGRWFWVEVDVAVSKDAREWRVFAWGDEQAKPGQPLVTASEPLPEMPRDLQVGVWAAGSGERRVEQLTLELLAGKAAGGDAETERRPPGR